MDCNYVCRIAKILPGFCRGSRHVYFDIIEVNDFLMVLNILKYCLGEFIPNSISHCHFNPPEGDLMSFGVSNSPKMGLRFRRMMSSTQQNSWQYRYPIMLPLNDNTCMWHAWVIRYKKSGTLLSGDCWMGPLWIYSNLQTFSTRYHIRYLYWKKASQ